MSAVRAACVVRRFAEIFVLDFGGGKECISRVSATSRQARFKVSLRCAANLSAAYAAAAFKYRMRGFIYFSAVGLPPRGRILPGYGAPAKDNSILRTLNGRENKP